MYGFKCLNGLVADIVTRNLGLIVGPAHHNITDMVGSIVGMAVKASYTQTSCVYAGVKLIFAKCFVGALAAFYNIYRRSHY